MKVTELHSMIDSVGTIFGDREIYLRDGRKHVSTIGVRIIQKGPHKGQLEIINSADTVPVMKVKRRTKSRSGDPYAPKDFCF